MVQILDSLCLQLEANTIAMGVIYKILKQQRHQQQQQQQQRQQQQQQKQNINTDIKTKLTKCKVQAAIRQRQLQRLEEQQQQQQQQDQQEQQQAQDLDETIAEEQLQQLCRFLAENAARKKRLKMQQQPLNELKAHDMELLMEHLSTCNEATTTATTTTTSGAPRDSILLKIRHQIFERKRQRQRQLAELVKQRLVVWRPW